MNNLLRKVLAFSFTFAATGLMSLAWAQGPDLPTYYFPEEKNCTILVDFQKERDDVERLGVDAQTYRLATTLVREFAMNGEKKCGGAKLVRMLAVFIPGTDNYGRPDFPNRINLLRIDGTPAALLQAAREGAANLDYLRSILTLTKLGT